MYCCYNYYLFPANIEVGYDDIICTVDSVNYLQ